MARMPFFILLFLAWDRGTDNPVTQIEVDLLEVNTMCDAECKPIFQQVIAWNVMPEDGKIHNVGWQIVNRETDLPSKSGRLWSLTAISKHQAVRIQSPQIRRTWTQTDPERHDSRHYWQGNPPNIFQACEAGRLD
jgi:hypothetical protein